ncbi:MAG: PTS system nitrogen regulatory IIA component [Phenylobacterium sp.]|jgi:PTS system nitrogen regulatory IIA component
MYLRSNLSMDCTHCAVRYKSKKRILQYISDLAHKKYPEVPAQDILDSLLSREKLGSTGIGNGIALPHGRLKGVTKSVAIFIVTENPLDYDAIDNQDVDVFCALLIPEENSQEHLSTLSEIAQMLTDKPLVKKIRHSSTNEELFSLIMRDE